MIGLGRSLISSERVDRERNDPMNRFNWEGRHFVGLVSSRCLTEVNDAANLNNATGSRCRSRHSTPIYRKFGKR